ncbi:hypothetical protein LIER_37208 [Lithospermum erythrorhizon]|uniref:Uncharacterized protein n=1 Tax=Lithospermum erythrorhizon TaxID=34254 RepID=A0AAV3PGW5_LITER
MIYVFFKLQKLFKNKKNKIKEKKSQPAPRNYTLLKKSILWQPNGVSPNLLVLLAEKRRKHGNKIEGINHGRDTPSTTGREGNDRNFTGDDWTWEEVIVVQKFDPNILGGLVVEFSHNRTKARQMERFLHHPVNLQGL